MLRRRRPLMRAAVGTAVIAGTATAVSGRVARRQNRRSGGDGGAEAVAQPAPAAPMPAPAPMPAAPATNDAMSPVEQIQMLADLREHGDLTDAEFESEKAKILAS